MISRAFCYISRGDKRRFGNGHGLFFTLQSKVSTQSCRDIMNSPISNIKAKWNSSAGLLRPAPGFTRHPIAIWLNQMLWVTNMASQLRAAQRTLSCLLGPAAQNTATPKTMWLLCRDVVYLIVAMACQVVVRLNAVNLWRSCRMRRLCGTRVLVQRGNDKNKSGDVMPLPNMWWNVTGMKSHSWGNTAGWHQTIVELWW